jgi:hypothetical protein
MGDFQSSGDVKHSGDNTIRKLFASLTSPDRVKVSIELQDDNGHPNVSFSLFDSSDHFIARAFIINCVDQHVDFTLHMRTKEVEFPLKLLCSTFFEDDDVIDQAELIIKE